MIDLYLVATDPTKVPQRKVKAKEIKGRSFSAHVRREAFKKADEKCENCGTQFALQVVIGCRGGSVELPNQKI